MEPLVPPQVVGLTDEVLLMLGVRFTVATVVAAGEIQLFTVTVAE